ncbi:MAG TPA: twin-arginine translocase subunit TatC, partial [Niastella sp.]|nr:twin-arginine translocase subunit TatC [Niastella sp.]
MASFLERRGNDSEMTFVDHLEALRWHIMRSVIAILVVSVVIFLNIDWVFDNIVMGPVRNNFVSYRALCNLSHALHIGNTLCMPPIPAGYKLLGTTVSGPFMVAIQIGVIGGLIAAFPYVFWEFWKFVKPALSPKELKYSRNAILFVSIFFFLGAAF